LKRYIKIGYWLIALLLLITVKSAFAQEEIKLVGSSKAVVEVGERFRIVYEVNAEGRNFTAPMFGNLQVLSGPNTSSSSSVQIINGKMQQSYSLTYTFVVSASKEGEVNISPATVKVDGKKYTSNTLQIQVVKATGGQQGTSGTNQDRLTEDGLLQEDDLYIKAFATNTQPYLGEQVIVTYRLYTRVPIANLSMKKASSFNGFWSKSLTDNNQQLQQSRQVINGKEYTVADIGKYAIFPQKTGKLTIEPAELECVAQIRVQQKKSRSNDPFEDFFNDPFFSRNTRNVETTLKSKPITIDVKPLPEQGKPADFTGAVGEFDFKSTIDRDQLTMNDALTLSMTISGKGNLELVNLPEPKLPSDFESYEPKITNNIKTSPLGISGSKKFEYLAIPRAHGDFNIEPVVFSFFNPKEKKYYSYSTGNIEIHVEKGDQSSSGVTYSSSAQEDIKFIGKDIRHIKTDYVELKQVGSYFFGTTHYYVLVVLPWLLMIIFIILWKQQEKKRSNVSMMKTRKANKIARARLQKADKFKKENNDKAFFDEIAQALWGYIADKFNIKQASLSIDTVKETLSEKNADEQVIDNFVNTLNNIEFARFAPGDASGKMATIYNEALDAITRAEKALK
jgi:hypothetical protein